MPATHSDPLSIRGIALLETCDDPSWLGHAFWALGLNLGHLGYHAQALDAMRRARDLAVMADDVRLEATVEWGSSWDYIALRDYARAIAAATRALEVAPDAVHRVSGLVFLGVALVRSRRHREGLEVLRSADRELQELTGHTYLRAWGTVNAGMALLALGETEAARREALRAVELSRRCRAASIIGHAERLVGLTLRAAGGTAEAEVWLRRALETLRDIHPEREVTLVHLARALHDRGEGAEAVARLRDAVAGFRERNLDRQGANAEALAREWAGAPSAPDEAG